MEKASQVARKLICLVSDRNQSRLSSQAAAYRDDEFKLGGNALNFCEKKNGVFHVFTSPVATYGWTCTGLSVLA